MPSMVMVGACDQTDDRVANIIGMSLDRFVGRLSFCLDDLCWNAYGGHAIR